MGAAATLQGMFRRLGLENTDGPMPIGPTITGSTPAIVGLLLVCCCFLDGCNCFLIDCCCCLVNCRDDEDNAPLAGGMGASGGKLNEPEDSDGNGVDREGGKGYNDES